MFLDELRVLIFGGGQGPLQVLITLLLSDLGGHGLPSPRLEARVVKVSRLGFKRTLTRRHHWVGAIA